MRSTNKDGTFYTDNGKDISRRSRKAVQGSCMEITWIAQKHYFKQRSAVCSKPNERVELDVGNQNKAIDSLPPINRWTN